MKLRLRVIEGPDRGRVLDIEDRQHVVVGRADDATLCLPGDRAMSRHHFLLAVDPPRLHLRDLDSRHGTLVNGRRITEAELQHGDRIEAAQTILRVERLDAAIASGADPTAVGSEPTRRGFDAGDPGRATGQLVGIRCRTCRAVAPHEPARAIEEDAVYLCERCQEALVANPVLPSGYRLVRLLGRGAMGCVYQVHALPLGSDRAIKQILPRAAMSARAREQFLREAREQGKLDHPNIVRVFDLAEPVPGAFSIVMEYVEGESADRLLALGPIAPELAVDLACQALAGIQHAHERDVVHRDLKEANLLITRGPRGEVVVKVADFGLAKNYQESGASGFTRDGTFGGTLAYMPREQLLDYRYVLPTADIYALGTTLYRLIAGVFPRDFQADQNPVLAVLELPAIPLARRVGWVSPRLAAVVDRALATDPAQRYRTAADMRTALIGAIS